MNASSRATGSTCTWGPAATSHRSGSRPGPVAEIDPDQEAALRRLRAAFGFVEVLRVVDHNDDQDQDDDESIEEGEQAPPADR
jgi:predicted secreted protein